MLLDLLRRYAIFWVLLLTVLAWLPVLQCGFVWDDAWLVTNNVWLDGSLKELFLVDYTALAGISNEAGYWRPVLLLTYYGDTILFGLHPAGWHLHSLLWHVLGVAALYQLLEQMRTRLLARAAGTLLFAIHPLQSEAVAWVAARNDPMGAALILLCLCAATAPLPPALLPKAGLIRLLLCAPLALAALWVKETALLLPLLILAMAWACPPKFRGDQRGIGWAAAGSALSLGFGMGVRRWLDIGPLPWPGLDNIRGAAERLPDLFAQIGERFWFPLQLSSSTHLRFADIGLLPWMAPGLTGLLILPILAGRSRLAWAGLLLSAATLAPTGLAVVNTLLFGERYLYLPMAGLGILVAARLPDRAAPLLPVALLPLLVLLQYRLPSWTDGLALFTADVANRPNAYNQQMFAWYLLDAKRPADALAQIEPIIDVPPPSESMYDTGLRAAVEVHRYDLAVRFARVGAWVQPERDDTYNGLHAFALAACGLFDEAIRVGLPTMTGDPKGSGALAVAAAYKATGNPEWEKIVVNLADGGAASVDALVGWPQAKGVCVIP